MNKNIIKGCRFYTTFMTIVYALYFVCQGLDIDLYDITYYTNDEWLLAVGLIGLLITNLMFMFQGRKHKEVVIEQKEEESK